MAVLRANVALAQATVRGLASRLPTHVDALPYPESLAHAIMTAPDKIPPHRREALDLLIGHYLPT